MNALTKTDRYRINSIDILRGLIMVVMALDHTRDFFQRTVITSGASVATNPTDMSTTTPALFFTRWVTHFCAPLFLFLAGVSAWLMLQKKTKAELSVFLLKRGSWLVFVEVVIITFGWTFNPFFNFLIFQVIWAIGISMILLGILVRLPFALLLVIGLIIVAGHNLMDYPSISQKLQGGFLADLMYFSKFSVYSLDKNHFILIVYAFLPWTGILILGYCFGNVFTPAFSPERRKKILRWTGAGLLLLFVLLRVINAYGDPSPWASQPRGTVFTILSFLNVTKYPPSLAFISLTLGAGLLVLAGLEGIGNRLTNFFRVYGRVPMFYYILHFYILHTIVVIVFLVSGYSIHDIRTPNNPFLFRPSSFGFDLPGVYLVWIFVVLVLYPLCRKYDRYKSTHHQWWLSYM